MNTGPIARAYWSPERLRRLEEHRAGSQGGLAMNTGPIARATDPITSHEAGAAITASGVRGTQQQAVLAAVQAQPGRTSAELAASSTLNRYTVARRLPELERLGEVIRGAVRECTASRLRAGRAVTWWPAAASVVEVESVAWDGPEGRLF